MGHDVFTRQILVSLTRWRKPRITLLCWHLLSSNSRVKNVIEIMWWLHPKERPQSFASLFCAVASNSRQPPLDIFFNKLSLCFL